MGQNINKAAKQLRGESGNPPEIPTSGHVRTVHLSIESSKNSYFDLDTSMIKQQLESIPSNTRNWQGIDRIRIDNNQGTHIFNISDIK